MITPLRFNGKTAYFPHFSQEKRHRKSKCVIESTPFWPPLTRGLSAQLTGGETVSRTTPPPLRGTSPDKGRHKKTPAPCFHGTGAENNFCGTTQIGASRPLCTHGHALRRDNGRGCRRVLLVSVRTALVRPFTLRSPTALAPCAARFAFPVRLLLLLTGLWCLIVCNVPPSGGFVNGFCQKTHSARIYSLRRPCPSKPLRTRRSNASRSSFNVPLSVK